MKNLFQLIVCLIAVTVITSCEKSTKEFTEGEISIYLLDDYQVLEENQPAIDESSVVPADEPLISYEELLSYNSTKYSFTINGSAKERIDELESTLSFKAFGVYHGDELIYTGYFWPAYSSSICSWIVIDLFMMPDNNLYVYVGYPGLLDGMSIPDRRNDERILDVFERDGKLLQ